MRYIQLTQGYMAVVDDEDYDRLTIYRWKILKVRSSIYAASIVARQEQQQHG